MLQDLSEEERQVVAIANGHVSGRSIGAPLTNVALRIISHGTWKTQDYELNYKGYTRDKRLLRSSTFFIKEKGKLLGMLCINIDVSRYQRLSEEILSLGGVFAEAEEPVPVAQNGNVENFTNNVTDFINDAVDRVLSESGIPADRMTQEERLDVVEKLNNQGVFLLKGAVSEVAKRIACSEASIYRYMSMVSKRKISQPISSSI